ncbi:lysozyme 1-like [Chrysoperla carnea]|uniref:lysozyme 1-like n=1 Tax=Chrysoperla carnea TaxID=189513 RepID=UPI001D09405F|nr:lysozyme 1-like [Chrysoperla carnea]
MQSKVLLLILIVSLNLSLGKEYTRCEFVRELYGHGMTLKELANWACIAELESGFNTNVTRGPGDDGSMDHGPFKISDRWWCVEGSKPSANYCRTKCQELRSDSISASINCARRIYYQQGYGAWHNTWLKYCDNQLPDYEDCFPIIRGRRMN